jgi:hypothetical protein
LSASTACPKFNSNFCWESSTSDSGEPGEGGIDDNCYFVVPSDGGVMIFYLLMEWETPWLLGQKYTLLLNNSFASKYWW